MSDDIVIGCITRYGVKDIELWVNSLDRCGYNGHKAMILYNSVPSEVVTYLTDRGYILYKADVKPSTLNQPILVDRFLGLYKILSIGKYDRVVTTDVKDVVFQSDPIKWLDHNQTKPLVIGSESIKCKDMPWSSVNYPASYPIEWEFLKDEVSHCAGVIAGNADFVKDFFLAVWRWSLTGQKRDTPDQAAVNVLINLLPFKGEVQKTIHKDLWVTHLGVSLNSPEVFGPHLTDTVPTFDSNGVVYDSTTNMPFVMVHQYERVASLVDLIKNAYS